MRVKVVIPIYRTLTPFEEASLRQTRKVLANYPIEIIYPEGAAIERLVAEREGLESRAVSNEWLGSKNGIAGYNAMCLSEEFYALYADYDYILICHTDAWIFRDELAEWCEKGYDYVGAPWPKRKKYDNPIIKCFLKLSKALFSSPTHLLRQDGFNKVGNGGLSLRKIESFIEACDRYATIIEYFKSHHGTRYNEDWFWAIIPKEFHYPTVREALRFSWDVKPELCYELAGGELPFGCHGWTKENFYKFWQPIIEPECV